MPRTRVIWCQCCPLWCCGGTSGRRRGAGEDGRGAHLRLIAQGVMGRLSQACARPRQLHDPRPPHCVRQASNTEVVCRGGGGAPALAGEGVVKGRLCMSMLVRQCAVLAPWARVRALRSLLPTISSPACVPDPFLFVHPRPDGCACSPYCLPHPFALYSGSTPLSQPLSHCLRLSPILAFLLSTQHTSHVI